MTKYRIIESVESDGIWYKVQKRYLFFWWTIRHAVSFERAKTYLADEKKYSIKKVTVLYAE